MSVKCIPILGYSRDVAVDIASTRHTDHTKLRRVFHTPTGDLTEVTIHGDPGPVYGDKPDPFICEYMLKEPADLERLRFLLPIFSSTKATILQTIIALVGDRGLVEAAPCQGAGGYPFSAYMGTELAMMLVYDDPEFLRQTLRLINDFYQDVMRRCLELGAPMIFDPWFVFSVSAGWSPALFKAFAMPLIAENVALAHGYGAFYHYYDDGAMDKTVDWVVEAGADLVENLAPPPLGDVNLAAVKRRIGDRTCLKGNVDQVNLIWRGAPAEVREGVRAAMEAGAPGGGFILSTADSMRPESPRENVDAYFDAWREFRR